MASSVTRSFSAPPYVIAGLGALEQLSDELEGLGARRLAIACDRGVEQAGLLTQVQGSIGALPASVCGLVAPDPTVEDAEQAVAQAVADGADAVVAVGGGSALAVGKAVALGLRNPGPILTYAGRDRAGALPAPCVAIPTTAGSGGEVSNAFTLHDPGQEQILVVRGRGYEPRVALLDATLLQTLPRRPMLEAGLDALSHALEALWAVNASVFTDALAVAATDAICSTLPAALEHRRPTDLQRLLEASAMANLACGNAGLGLIHALSSAAAVHLTHGYQNGVLLPAVAAFNGPNLKPAAAAAVDCAKRLYAEIDFEASFGDGTLDAADVDHMVSAALKHDFRRNNIRAASEPDLRAILASVGGTASPRSGVWP
ncbi:MAG: iron-containing alcohol dehydrogenase [Actinomycetota bacterium]|nr:iron-containing alcohol dehydrogenase [Actinomycetota bacterium]